MSGDERVSLPPDVLPLLDDERERPGASRARADAVLGRVRATVAGGGHGGGPVDPSSPVPGAVSTSVRAWWLAGGFLAGALAGVGVSTLRPPRQVIVERRVTVQGPERVVERVVVREVVRAVETPAVIAPTTTPPAPTPRTTASTLPPAATPAVSLAAERRLIEQASSALLRDNPAAALAAVQAHARRFPEGYLGEERDSIEVRALSALGRSGEARDRAAEFHRRHPNSMLGATVDRAVEGR